MRPTNEEAMSPAETTLLRFFAGALYQFQPFENTRKEQSDVRQAAFLAAPLR